MILLRLIANYIAPSFVTILYFINDLLVLAIICLTISTVIFLLHIKNSIPDCIWFIVSFSPPILVFLLYVVREVGLYSIDVVSLSNYPIFLVTLGVENLFLWAIIWEVLCVSVLLVYRLHKLLHDNFNMYVTLERQRIEGVELLMRSIEGERRRVAQELHDGSGVVLTALRMKLMQIIDDEDVRDCKKNLQKMLNDIDHLTVEIREISHFIMPISLSKLGLMAGIHELIDKLNLVNSTIDFQLFQFYEENRLTSDQQINIYRICQELLNNAIKHAKASQVVLNLVQDVDILSISMEDNGVGFDSGMIIKGMGMNNINLRVKLMLGTFQFESDSKKGSFFQIKLPFNKP